MPPETPAPGSEPDDPSSRATRAVARAIACASAVLVLGAQPAPAAASEPALAAQPAVADPAADSRPVPAPVGAPVLDTQPAPAAVGAPVLDAQASSAAPQGRLIVLGFDGADARTVEDMMDRGELPHLAALRAKGTYAPLGTTVPAESPVSWAALNSGQNPAKTGVPGFVKRELPPGGDPQPTLGHQVHEARATESFAIGPALSFLVRRTPLEASAWAGVGVLLFSLLLFSLLLRLRARVALPLALLLTVLGAWAGWRASVSVPRRIVDVVGNPARVGGFWEVAARAGVKSVVLDAAMGWDRPAVENARVLAGLGVPDVRGANGDWFVYTTDPAEVARPPEGRSTSTGGKVFRVDEVDGRIETSIYGPRDLVRIDRVTRDPDATEEDRDAARGSPDTEAGRLEVPLTVVRRGDRAVVSIDGQDQELADGQWSQWFHLTFESNALFKVRAVTRVKIQPMEGPFSLYVDFLQIDPAAPPFWQSVSQPEGFAGELAQAIGAPYETVGWACMTMPFKDRRIDPRTFLEDIEFTEGWRVKLLQASLARTDWRLLMSVESTPDRVQHMMYQYFDPSHPLHDAKTAAGKTRFFGSEIPLSEAIPATYREMDRLVGEVVDRHLAPDDTLIVCSDHGFQSFRRGVNLNNWLFEHRYLALREGTAPARDGNNYLRFVDWERTRAYAVGLGMIFLNLEGRESQGIVRREDASALMREIGEALLATQDGGRPVVRDVYRMGEIHSGPYLDLEADLMPGFEAGYRVGWLTTTGGIKLKKSEDGSGWVPGDSIEDNANNWSGDHVSVAQDLVRGVFFCNRKVKIPEGGVSLLDVAPTALSVLGVPVPTEYDRPPLRVLD